MSFYDDMAATALRLIKSKGQSITLRRKSYTYDPETGSESESFTDYTADAVVLPASQGTIESFDNRLEKGTLIETRIRALKIAASGLSIEPEPGDEVIGLEGHNWVFLGVTPINPAGTPLVYSGTVKR